MQRTSRFAILLVFLSIGVAACARTPVFSPEVRQGVDHDFDFAAWRMMPSAQVGRKVQLGGRIIEADIRADQIVVIVTHLPIVEHPAFGPKDTGKRSGEYAISYAGHIDAKWLVAGNHLMVVGTTERPKAVIVDDVQRSLPSLIARCVHIWKTGRKEIAEFPFNAGGGYEPLEEETFCSSGE
ncbi:MAG: Slp family lipoprotein [Nitrospiraceae bacterium]